MQVLAMEFVLGSVTFTLGQVLIAGILLDQGRKFFFRLSGGSVMDERANRHGFKDYEEYSAFQAYIKLFVAVALVIFFRDGG